MVSLAGHRAEVCFSAVLLAPLRRAAVVADLGVVCVCRIDGKTSLVFAGVPHVSDISNTVPYFSVARHIFFC
jgi:hypothetical protein